MTLYQSDDDFDTYSVTLGLPGGVVQVVFAGGEGSVFVRDNDGQDLTARARAQAYGLDKGPAHVNTAADVLCLMLWVSSRSWDHSIEQVAKVDAEASGEDWDALDDDMRKAYLDHARYLVYRFLSSIDGR